MITTRIQRATRMLIATMAIAAVVVILPAAARDLVGTITSHD